METECAREANPGHTAEDASPGKGLVAAHHLDLCDFRQQATTSGPQFPALP